MTLPRLPDTPAMRTLKDLPQWLPWKKEQRPGAAKPTKVPYSAHTGRKCDATDPRNFAPWGVADRKARLSDMDGVGFGLLEGDGIAGYDLDNCRDPVTGEITPWALTIVGLAETYTEISPSSAGIRIFSHTKPETNRSGHGAEVYRSRRYLTVTGQHLPGTPVEIRESPRTLAALLARIDDTKAAPGPSPSRAARKPPAPPRRNGAGGQDDGGFSAEDAEAALTALANDYLDRGDWLRIGMSFFAAGGSFDAWDAWSRQHASYDAGETRRVWQSFERSGIREVTGGTLLNEVRKRHPGWLSPTARARVEAKRLRAEQQQQSEGDLNDDDLGRGGGSPPQGPPPPCGGGGESDPPEPEEDPEEEGGSEQLRIKRRAKQIQQNIAIGEAALEPELPTILTTDEMKKRLLWIRASGAIVDTVTGRVSKKEHAADEYAASTFIPEIPEDDDRPRRGRPPGSPKPLPCLAAWKKSRHRRMVDALAWIPGEPTTCRVPEGHEGNRTAFNTWRGLEALPYPNDWHLRVMPFLRHLTYLIPVKHERKRFLQWLAHIIQQPEVLPHTCYLMITETTGIGRNLLASILVRVIRGHTAVGVSLAEVLDGSFNGRLSRKLLAVIDEAREGPSSNRYQRENKFRQITTEEHREINPKFGLKSIEKNCLRWLLFSNYLDAVAFNAQDRRVEVIFNPTVRKPDAYYERLYALVNDPAFIGSVRHYLETVDIKDFKPGAHATMNAAKRQVLTALKTDTESVIEDFKATCFEDIEENGVEKSVCIRPLVFRSDILEAIKNSGSDTGNATHINHAITNAGMRHTGKRIKDAFNKRQNIIIVDTVNWTVEKVLASSAYALTRAMEPQN